MTRSTGTAVMCVIRQLLILTLLLGSSSPYAQGPADDGVSGESWLGVWLSDTVDGGVQVVHVVPDGPCQRAGLQVGDLLLRADTVDLTDQDRLRTLLTELPPGASLRLTVLRDGEPVEAVVRAGRRPAPRVPRSTVAVAATSALLRVRVESGLRARALGIRVAEITPALRRHYGAPEHAGVLVIGLDPGRPADVAGVEVGDVLVSLDDREIVSSEQLASVIWTWNGNRPLRAALVRAEQPRVVELSVAGVEEPKVRGGGGGDAIAPRADRPRSVDAERLRREIDRLQNELARLKRRLATLEDSGSESR